MTYPMKFAKTVFTGDSVILGKTQMFRFNNPEEAALLRDRRAVRIRNVFIFTFIIQ